MGLIKVVKQLNINQSIDTWTWIFTEKCYIDTIRFIVDGEGISFNAKLYIADSNNYHIWFPLNSQGFSSNLSNYFIERAFLSSSSPHTLPKYLILYPNYKIGFLRGGGTTGKVVDFRMQYRVI